ncbi:MAG: hypothetical protein IPK82_37745 [Polyangiaceae bacterium]|nr:hypothetical protein [Polyangiaceae bacterium]
MKPGDHPNFFRFAPPPGTSRESTITLDRNGEFFHNGERVDHPALRQALRSWVALHPDDHRPILTNGYDWCYFRPEIAPIFVTAVSVHTDATVTLTLFNNTTEPLNPNALFIDAEGIVYTRTQNGMLARFTRHAQTGLLPLLVNDDPPTIEIQQKTYPIAPLTSG